MTSKEMLSKIEGLLPKPCFIERNIHTIGTLKEGSIKTINRLHGLTICFGEHEYSRDEVMEIFRKIRNVLPDLDRAALEEEKEFELERRIILEGH